MSQKYNVLLQLYAKAYNSRDYYGLTVSTTEIILNKWNVSRGRYVYPKRYKLEHDEFLHDRELQNLIQTIFGSHVYKYTLELCNQTRNLQYLPTKLFLYILRYLATNDILKLSQTSKIFFDLCNSEAVWELIFRNRIRKTPSYEENQRAKEIGWKAFLKNKLFANGDLKKNRFTCSKPILSKAVIKPKEVQKKINETLVGRNPARNITNSKSSLDFDIKSFGISKNDGLQRNSTSNIKGISNLPTNTRNKISKFQ